jgi:hypothetical protein
MLPPTDNFKAKMLSTSFGVTVPKDMKGKALDAKMHECFTEQRGDPGAASRAVDHLYNKLAFSSRKDLEGKAVMSIVDDFCEGANLLMTEAEKGRLVHTMAEAVKKEQAEPHSSPLAVVQHFSRALVKSVARGALMIGPAIQKIPGQISRAKEALKHAGSHEDKHAIEKHAFVNDILMAMHVPIPNQEKGKEGKGCKEAEKLFQAIQKYNQEPDGNEKGLLKAWEGLCNKFDVSPTSLKAGAGIHFLEGLVRPDRLNPFQTLAENIRPPGYEESQHLPAYEEVLKYKEGMGPPKYEEVPKDLPPPYTTTKEQSPSHTQDQPPPYSP